jgi:lipid-binding SYLF domain-containing protein
MLKLHTTRWVFAIVTFFTVTTVHSSQEALDLNFPKEPPVSCLGIKPCNGDSESIKTGGHGETKRHRWGMPDNFDKKIASEMARLILEQVYALPEADKRFIFDKLEHARGFAIFPEVQRSGVIAARVYGKGIVSFRITNEEWSPPILLTMQGQSIGPQLCAQCSRIVFIFDTICGIKDFLTGHHHLVSSVLGTSIEHVDHPEPDEPLDISIYTIHNGVTMGQSLDNYTIHIDEEANAALYGIEIKPGCIVEGVRIGPKPPWFQQFYERMLLPPGQPHGTTQIK